MEGHDVVATAQTGTGRTLALSIAMIEALAAVGWEADVDACSRAKCDQVRDGAIVECAMPGRAFEGFAQREA
jgi:superfamily II DNA/RNA helicase